MNTSIQEAEIIAAEAQLSAAILAGDVAAKDQLLADESIFATPDGNILTKAADLAASRSGLLDIKRIESTEFQFLSLGEDVAVTTSRSTMELVYDGRPMANDYRFLRVWKKTDGKWRMAAGHCCVCAE